MMKQHPYWQGIAHQQGRSTGPKTGLQEAALQFLDSAFLFVKKLKGKVHPQEPSEIKLYERWKALTRK